MRDYLRFYWFTIYTSLANIIQQCKQIQNIKGY